MYLNACVPFITLRQAQGDNDADCLKDFVRLSLPKPYKHSDNPQKISVKRNFIIPFLKIILNLLLGDLFFLLQYPLVIFRKHLDKMFQLVFEIR